MLENRRSLASYFDEGQDTPHNWHEQMLMGEELSGYQNVDGHAKKVFVPDGQSPGQKPANKKFHYQGKGPFKPDEWGYDQAKAAAATARFEQRKQKHEHGTGDHPEHKKKKTLGEKIKFHAKQMADQESAAMRLWLEHKAWEQDPYLFDTMDMVVHNLRDSKIAKNTFITAFKARYPITTGDTKELKKHNRAARSKEIHQILYGFMEKEAFVSHSLGPWQAHLLKIQKWCNSTNTPNLLGTSLPQNAGSPDRYFMSVAHAFYGKVKRQIMDITVHKLSHQDSRTEEQEQFLRHSALANVQLIKMIKLKKYNKKQQSYADTPALQDWHEKYLEREIEVWRRNNPKQEKLPYYLLHQMKPPPGYKPQPRTARANPRTIVPPPPPRTTHAYMQGYRY